MLPDLPGVNIRYDTVSGVFTGNFATFPPGSLPNPVDLVASSDGSLYAVGRSTGFHQVNATSGSRLHAWPIPDLPGDYRRAQADPSSGELYLLRDTTGPMLMDNDRRLRGFGKNGGAAALSLEDAAGPPLWETACLDLAGTTNHAPGPRRPREISPAGSSRPLAVAHTADPALLRLAWESPGDPGVACNRYQGSLDEPGLHAPLGCHLPGAAGPRMAEGAAPACGPPL